MSLTNEPVRKIRKKWIIIAPTYERIAYWRRHKAPINVSPRDIVEVVGVRDLDRLRGWRLDSDNVEVVIIDWPKDMTKFYYETQLEVRGWVDPCA